MGVHGLTTYLRENQRILGETNRFPPAHVSEDTITTIVVDGWSFIYEVYNRSRLPWAYGGEYDAFARCVLQVVKAWMAVGLKVYFVFDGASPELKIPTLISRLNRNHVQNSVLFFRTSPTSRSNPRFLHENRIIPPLVLRSCVEALESLAKEEASLEVHFADEEADPYAVELAGRLGAYVVGNDSDFVIFNSGRYAGCILLDEILWTAQLPINESSSPCEDQEDGFQTVVGKTKKRSKPTSQQTTFGLIPPEDIPLSDLVLSVTVYTPSTLALHLKLPTTLLPLLASLIGNDFSNHSATQRNVQSLFFERNLTLSQRITHVAVTLSSILNAAVQRRKAKHQVGSVMDLIDRTVNALLVRSPSSLAGGEIDGIVDRIVNAALQYAIDKYEGEIYGPASLWPTPFCALHGGDSCPLLALFSRAHSQSQKPRNVRGGTPENGITTLRSLHVKAFRAGKLDPKIADILNTGTFWPRIFLDSPDIENVSISIGRPIRSWIYALLDDGVGLPETPEKEIPPTDGSLSDTDEAEEDPDELIEVVEEDSDADADLLAPLRGELRRLRGAEGASSGVPLSASSRSRSRPPTRLKYVSEYVRRGTRIASEEVPVPDLAALMISSGFDEDIDTDAWLPVQLRSVGERMALLLRILGSDVPSVMNAPPDRLMPILVVRWIVQTLHQRSLEAGVSKERHQERWTRQEARAVIGFYGSPPPRSTDMNDTASHTNGLDTTPPVAIPLTDRNVQLMAQTLMAIETIHLLVQVLFLTEQVPANVHLLSGQRLHAYLAGFIPVPEEVLAPSLWSDCIASLDDAFAPERQKKTRKARIEHVKPTATANNKTTSHRRGLFSLLGDDVT